MYFFRRDRRRQPIDFYNALRECLSDEDDDSGFDQPLVAHKKRGRPRGTEEAVPASKANSQPWGTIMIMDEAKLEETLQNHLEQNTACSAADFLQFCQQPPGRLISNPEEFSKFNSDVHAVTLGGSRNNVFRLFLYLRILEVANVLENKWIKVQDGNENIRKTLKKAQNLEYICGKFGDGCIFWLYSRFTDNL
ncbi:MAG: hypothetical protein Q9166_004035 [cf. Caloplaca sp. 2 TL-2023]